MFHRLQRTVAWLHFSRSPALPLLLLASVSLLGAGCAQVPAGEAISHLRRQLIVNFDVAGQINSRYYYFIAIDTAGDPTVGPVPVVSAPWGNGWVTGAVTHFVQYHLGNFNQYQFRANTNLLVADPIGPPFAFNRPELEGNHNHVSVTIDLDTLGTNVSRINLNLITTDRIDIEPTFLGTKFYDGLGTTGNRYVNIPIDRAQTYYNSQSLEPEQAGDLPPQPSPDITVEDLDLTDWSVEVRLSS